MSDAKRILRARMRAARDDFAMTSDAAVVPPPAFLAMLKAEIAVASYIPIGGEADPTPLAAAARAAGCTLLLPHVVDRESEIRFLEWDPAVPLQRGPFGLRQPGASAPERAPSIILTPLVAFDGGLARLGQGAGHYDRAFARYPDAYRLGIAWSVQQVDRLETDPWDMPLHAIVTEKAMLS